MDFQPNQLFHVFNQGNNRQPIFNCPDNYFVFLSMFRKYVAPHCDVIAWCLMPNHFHFLLNVNDSGAQAKQLGAITSCNLCNGFRLLLSHYALYFNARENRSGSLFRQKTKFKNCESILDNYRLVVFDYIHNNPVEAGLVDNPEDWIFSSYNDYFIDRPGSLINRILAAELIGLQFGYPGV